MRDIVVLSSACGAFFMPGFFKCLKANKEEISRLSVAIYPMILR